MCPEELFWGDGTLYSSSLQGCNRISQRMDFVFETCPIRDINRSQDKGAIWSFQLDYRSFASTKKWRGKKRVVVGSFDQYSSTATMAIWAIVTIHLEVREFYWCVGTKECLLDEDDIWTVVVQKVDKFELFGIQGICIPRDYEDALG